MTDDNLANFYDRKVGPFFDADGLSEAFGMTAEFLKREVASGGLLRVVSRDGFALFPSFQFDASGGLLPWMAEMLTRLDPDGSDPWGDANWLNTPADELGQTTPAAALRSGRHGEALALARQAGAFRLP